jgi:hypothetical protein
MVGPRDGAASVTAIRNIKSPFKVGPIEPVKAKPIEINEAGGTY